MYVDTTSLVAFFIPETNTERVHPLIIGAEELYVSSVSQPEFISALKRKIRMGAMTNKEIEIAVTELERQIRKKLFNVIELKASHFNSSIMMMKETINPLRTIDALHLAVCYEDDIPLLSLDKGLLETAREFDIKITNPYSG